MFLPFENGYAVSIIETGIGVEVALLDGNGHLVYKGPMKEDVVRLYNAEALQVLLKEIANLPPIGS